MPELSRRRRTGAPRATLALSLLAPLWGCAAFRSGHLPEIPRWPPEAEGPRKTIAVSSAPHESQGRGGSLLTEIHLAAIEAFESSGLFASVLSGDRHAADLRARIVVRHTGKWYHPLHGFFSGVTLFLIPLTAWDEFEVKTQFLDDRENVLGTVELKERVTLWVQTFLIVAAPFRTARSVLKATHRDLFRATLLEALQTGILGSPVVPAPPPVRARPGTP